MLWSFPPAFILDSASEMLTSSLHPQLSTFCSKHIRSSLFSELN